MVETRMVSARGLSKTGALPALTYRGDPGEEALRKLPHTRLALAMRLAMIVERAGRK